MASGKKSHNAPTEEFILEAPAPVDVAAKISAIYRGLSIEVLHLSSEISFFLKSGNLQLINILFPFGSSIFIVI